MKKVFFVFGAILFIGIQVFGCREKQKEPMFEQSRVNSKVSAGFVDLIEPAENIPIKSLIHMGGWANDPYKRSTSKGVIILSDGKQLPVSPQLGLERVDVVKALQNDALLKSGWDTSFNASLLGKGRHKLEFYSVLHDDTFAPLIYKGKTFYELEVVQD